MKDYYFILLLVLMTPKTAVFLFKAALKWFKRSKTTDENDKNNDDNNDENDTIVSKEHK